MVIVQLVLVKETNVATKSKKAKTTILGIYKKRKTADENLRKYAKENAVDTQWDLLRDHGTGVAGGYEFSFAVLPITENVPNGAVIEELFEE